MRVALIDYDSGNLHSAEKAFQLMGRETGAQVQVTSDPEVAARAERALMRRLEAGCAAPVGAIATPVGDGRTRFRLWAPSQRAVAVRIDGGQDADLLDIYRTTVRDLRRVVAG